jgi:hypothetical protein
MERASTHRGTQFKEKGENKHQRKKQSSDSHD